MSTRQSLLRAFATVSGMTLISRVTGFVRDILIAGVLGAGLAADAFLIAFQFPNLFRRLFAEGAFSAGFVPIFSEILEKEGRDKALRFAEQSFAVLATFLFEKSCVGSYLRAVSQEKKCNEEGDLIFLVPSS